MIQNAIVRLSKYVVLFALLLYIAILSTSRWHDIRVYPQKLGCTKGKDAIVVKKNILWSIVYKKIEITKENSHYKSLMAKIKEIKISANHTRPLKQFPYWGFGFGIHFCYKDKYAKLHLLIPFGGQDLYDHIRLIYMPKIRHRAKYSKEKKEQFFDDVNKAIEEQNRIDSKSQTKKNTHLPKR